MISVRFFAALLAAAPVFAAARGSSVVIDPAGNVWSTGATSFLVPTATAFQKTAAGTVCGTQQLTPFDRPTAIPCLHGYLTKQDAAGNVLYSTYLGGRSQESGMAITADAAGNAYVTGYTYSPDFPVTNGAAQAKNNGPLTPGVYVAGGFPFGPASVVAGGDAFVAKFAPDGTLLFSTLLGGSGSDVPLLIGVDGAGSVYVAGYTNSMDFPVAGGAIAQQPAGSFFARLNASGTAVVYASYSTASILGFDIDGQGRVYLTGAGPNNTPYVTVVDTSGGGVVRSMPLQGVGAGVAIAVDAPQQNLFVGISPAAPPYHPYFAPQPVRPLGASALLELTIDASRMLAETDVNQTQLDSILFDAAGNVYAFAHGTGALPAGTVPLLEAPCSPRGGSFVLEWNGAGKIVAATYFRQGDDTAVAVTSPGKILANHAQPAGTVTLDLSAPPAANFGCPKNLASGIAGLGLAPGEIFLLTGSGIGPAQGIGAAPDGSGLYPTSLGGVQVLIGGKAAPLLYVQANEIHAVAPFALTNLPKIEVRFGNVSAPPLDAAPASVNPGIFSIDGQGAVVNQDGTVNTPANPAKLGSIVSVYCTGTGYLEFPAGDGGLTPIPPPFLTTQLTPLVTFAGVAGMTLWSGSAPGLIFGVTQVNVQLPRALPAGTVPMMLQVGAAASPAVSISVKQ